MTHQRQGWRRLVALPVALLGALVIAPGLALASPNSAGSTTLDFTDCQAHVVVDWSAQPGKLKSYTVEISSLFGTTATLDLNVSMARSGHVDYFPTYSATTEFSNQFTAVTHVYDGKGIEQATWTSNVMAAACI